MGIEYRHCELWGHERVIIWSAVRNETVSEIQVCITRVLHIQLVVRSAVAVESASKRDLGAVAFSFDSKKAPDVVYVATEVSRRRK